MTITATYGGKSASVTVKVIAKPEAPKLNSCSDWSTRVTILLKMER